MMGKLVGKLATLVRMDGIGKSAMFYQTAAISSGIHAKTRIVTVRFLAVTTAILGRHDRSRILSHAVSKL